MSRLPSFLRGVLRVRGELILKLFRPVLGIAIGLVFVFRGQLGLGWV